MSATEEEYGYKMYVSNNCPWRQREDGEWYCACDMHAYKRDVHTTRSVYVPPPADHEDKYTRAWAAK